MKLTVSVPALRDALAAARYATPANPAVVAYSGVQLAAADSTLTLTGFDGDFSVRARAAATVSTPGSFLVQPRPLAAYLATLGDGGACELSVVDGDLELVIDAQRPYRFRPVTAAFPAPPTVSTDPVAVDFSRFAQALSAVRAAVSRDTPAVQVLSSAAGVTLHATDNYRLARAHLSEAGFGDFTGLVPLPVLERVARSGVTAVRVDPASRVIVFESPAMTLTTRLLVSSSFPAVEGVLAAVPPSRVRIPTEETLRALAPLAALTESSSELSPVVVSLDQSRMTLAASNVDTGSGVEDVTLKEAIQAPFSFQVRLSYLREALAGIQADEVTLAFSSAQQPLYLLATTPVETTLVVMPVRA